MMSDVLRTASLIGRSALGSLGRFLAPRSRRDRAAGGSGLRGRLFRKYVLLLVGLVALVLLVNAGLHFWFSYGQEETAAYRFQQEKARSAAGRIEEFIEGIEHQLGWTTAPQWAAAPVEQRQFDYVRLLRQVPAITELIQLDGSGKEQLRVSRLAMDLVGSGKDYSHEHSFIEAKANRVWFSPVYFRKESEPYLTLAMAQAGRNAGVTIAEVNLKLIWDVISGMKIGEGGYAYVIDRNGRLIAHPDISLVLRDTDMAGLPQVAAVLAPSLPSPASGGGLGWGQIAPPAMVAKNLRGEAVLTAHAAIVPLGWTVFVELPLREAMAPLYAAAWQNAALLAVAIGLTILAAMFLARRMTGPIRQLQTGAARIGAGELDRRIAIHTGDELEELAGEFNRMAGDLQKSYAELEQKVEDRTAELKEALDQQTATAEVLGVINSSPGDLAPVFAAILEKAHSLCGVDRGALVTYDGERFLAVATHGMPERYAEVLSRPYRADPSTPNGRLLRGERFVHIPDLARAAALAASGQAGLEAGSRTVLLVALRNKTGLLGYISAHRTELRPFADKEIALLENFAAQAVIAMENARLLTETRESLEQQQAIAEILQVINRSPGELQPVFEILLEKAMQLCGAAFGILAVLDREQMHTVTARGLPPALAEWRRNHPLISTQNTLAARVLAGEPYVHTLDLKDDELYRRGESLRRANVDLGGARTSLYVPLLRDRDVLGTIHIYRQEVRPFTEKQIALLQNFAAQAVIAMENARLLTETREALEQQTATAEVLQVINSSPGNLAPVFDAMLEKAIRLCSAVQGALWLIEGERARVAAARGLAPEFVALLRERGGPTPPLQRVMRGERVVHYLDTQGSGLPFVEEALAADVRTLLWVALVREGAPLGAFAIARRDVRAFSDKEIALLQNFAAQAVIAIENARLITETREALEQQTATAEVLRVINSSPGDLAPVFDAMLEKATHLCEASFGVLCTYDGASYRATALREVPTAYADFLTAGPLQPGPGNGLARVAAGEKVVHVLDVAAEDIYRSGESLRRALVDLGRARTVLTVALLKDDVLLGAFIIYRQEVRPFTDQQIALVQNFAAQAVIAMENARLLTETREALEQQTATAEVLGVINSSPGDLAPVFAAMLEKATTLCGAAFGTLLTYDGERFTPAAACGVPAAFADFRSERGSFAPPPGSSLERVLHGENLVHIADVAKDRGQAATPLVQLGGCRALLCVALRRDDNLVGAITAYRQEVRPFSDKQIALLQNFAAQAVIAMENARLINETREALEQQTATAEVLQVINSSPGDLPPVFDAMLEKLIYLCNAQAGYFLRYDEKKYSFAAGKGLSRELSTYMADMDQPTAGDANARILQGEAYVHVTDLKDTDLYQSGSSPLRCATVDLGGIRTGLAVPLRKDGKLLGNLCIGRFEVRPFSEKQITIAQNFAAQAVIAMENARLITETREALAQQTATAEVLGVINSSPGDLAPVFDAMLERATRLCEAPFGILRIWDGERFQFGAVHGAPRFSDWVRQRGPFRPASDDSLLGRIIAGERVVSFADALVDQGYRSDPGFRRMVEASGIRSGTTVALHKDDALLGTITVYRQEVRPFADKQIALLQNFAAQAVIAMENARLITETREALEQQTATAEVLQVINSSPGDLAPVFDAMLDKALVLCEAVCGQLAIYDGECFEFVALKGDARWVGQHPRGRLPPSRGTTWPRLVNGEPFVHIADARDTEIFRSGQEQARDILTSGGRTFLTVGLRREHALLGALTVYRTDVRPFSEKQIALLQNFAAQAVIAMENARLITETREALEQQTATAEVLQVINSSPGDLAPVFDAMLDKALKLCDAALGYMLSCDGEVFHRAASRGFSPELEAALPPPGPTPGSLAERFLRGEKIISAINLMENDAYRLGAPAARALVDVGGVRSYLAVALRNGEQLVGVIAIYRQEVRPFTDKQIALLQNFAAQAVIAMENARLITETREALEQQTATAEVLQVINSSPGDLAPVFDAMLERAMYLCGAAFGQLGTYDGERFRTVAQRGVPAAYIEYRTRHPTSYGPGAMGARILAGERVVQVLDMMEGEDYRAGDPNRRALVDLGGARTSLVAGLFKDDAILGFINIYRQEVKPFTDKQIALLQNFAAQAVIAMENARLITELRQRTHDLQESLEYQTAVSDVLKVISRSAFELEPVLKTVIETAARLCLAEKAIIYRYEDGAYRYAVGYGNDPQYDEIERETPIYPGQGSVVGRMALEGRTVQIADAWADPLYEFKDEARTGNVRTMIGVPLVRDGATVGAIALARGAVEPFSEKQIELVTVFADQAVIAIENARLFNELRARTAELGRSVEELRLLSEVGQAVSSTLDVRAVLSTILTRSVALAGADAGAIFRYNRAERSFRLVEAIGWDASLKDAVGDLRVAEAETAMGEAAARRMPMQLADLANRPSAPLRDASLAAGIRGVLIVPLVGPDRILGALILQRRAIGEFPAETVRLMQTLASQSVLAIQNARLFREIADKSEQLALASQHKSQFLANMSHELRTPLNAILGYAELLVDGIYGALPERPKGVLERIQNNGKHLLALINDVLDLAKIEAGQLNLTLEDYSLPEVVRSVVTATEPLATSKGLRFTAVVAENLPTAHGDARRVSQVLLNLVGNAIKFTDAGEVEIRTSAERGQFVLTVRDTGPGIPETDQERIFGEFQQIDDTNTRKKGGTGLGLAISKRMVEMQGGTISVESALGQGSTFRVVLPVHVEAMLEEAAE